MPLTIAERRLLARQKRQEEEEAAKLAKEKALEEKRERARALRQATRAKDTSHRRKCTILGSMVHCRYCGDMIDQYEFDDHKVTHPTQIRERIWLGNAENSKDMEVMKKCGITHILNCTREIDLPKNISKKIKSFKRIAIQDKTCETILDYINDSNAFIEKALSESRFHVVFVHCREGRSRSVSFLSAYLMWKEKVSFHAVLSDITSKRHIVLPNNKFYAELEKFDKELIVDRKKNGSKKFGKPSASFKLKKLKGNQQRRMADGLSGVVDDLKSELDGAADGEADAEAEAEAEEDEEIDVDDVQVSGLRRRSSLSDLKNMGTRTAMRISMEMEKQRRDRNRKKKSSKKKKTKKSKLQKSGDLSPITGSPVGKRKKAADGWTDVVYDTPKKNGTVKNGKKKKSSKKQKSSEDLQVEEAVDVSDVFPNGTGKKKAKSKKKKKSKKAT